MRGRADSPAASLGRVGTILTPPSPTDGGAYVTDFAQQGTSRIYGFDGGPAILSIDALAPRNISFDPAGGLRGPTTWLVLAFGEPRAPAAALGTAIGQVFVKALDVSTYGAGGSAPGRHHQRCRRPGRGRQGGHRAGAEPAVPLQ